MSPHVEEWLDKYLDGELSPVQQDRVKAHLNSCSHCQELLTQRSSLSALLQMAPAASDLKPADQFVAEVGLQLKGRPAASHKSPAANTWHWAWALVPMALLLVLVFMQTVSVLSDILGFIPGAEQASQQSVQALPVFTTLSQLNGNALVAQGADLLAFFNPTDLGWLTNLAVLVVIGLLYASWIAGWWVRSQQAEA
jgi:predicted anti-sigma-YlaC factor YlaD